MELLNALAFMLQNQYQPNVITVNTVINGFYKMGRIEEALKEVFNFLHHIMPERVARSGVMTYNAILHSLFKLQQANEAIGTFNRMASEGILVDSITYRAYVHLV
uniref:Pentatricopeptide repeat-containing protein n=1 Tax=Quercus lobata TaxID=97700 RepID=A0A7N2MQK4_QUELO